MTARERGRHMAMPGTGDARHRLPDPQYDPRDALGRGLRRREPEMHLAADGRDVGKRRRPLLVGVRRALRHTYGDNDALTARVRELEHELGRLHESAGCEVAALRAENRRLHRQVLSLRHRDTAGSEAAGSGNAGSEREAD
ncbi:hypothetical protein WIS52_24285 [Pseudonocardia nematodicida]|uniref:BZIP domain-containing protein n=1 Tax=Pseudonocardia nematodicida TaxID=1206997 RepID=A0ABV1KGL6_9PSEU